MVAFTVYFCGTGSNSYDFSNTNYVHGELISTLAKNNAGSEFVDWIIVDGPGSGNLQEAEKWVPSKNYSNLRGNLQGKGWEENVQHAVAVLLGVTAEDRTVHTEGELKLLEKFGVQGVSDHTVHKRFLRSDRHEYTALRPRISPQALQAKKVEIMRGKITRVNAVGWSRGAVTCIMFANALAETDGLSHLPVNIFACDPVPGSGQFDTHRTTLQANVENYVGIYARDERSRGFTPVLPHMSGGTIKFITTIPGKHATLVGNANATGGGDTGFNYVYGPGKVTRQLAEAYLQTWGASHNDKLGLSDLEILRLYDVMLANSDVFNSMKSHTYTTAQWGQRSVGAPGGSSFGSVHELQPDPYFINSHHRRLFRDRYPAFYRRIFEGAQMSQVQYIKTKFEVHNSYLNHYIHWTNAQLL